jgi:hypothetical protein
MVSDKKRELEVLIRARYPILYVVSWEEARVAQWVSDVARKRDKKLHEWSFNTGLVPYGTSLQSQKTRNQASKDPLVALDHVVDQVEPAIFLFKDFHPFLARTNFAVIRKLKEIAIQLKNSTKTIILVSPILEIPVELEKEITVIDFPLPTVQDFGELLDRIIEDVKDNPNVKVIVDRRGSRERRAGSGGGGLRQTRDRRRARIPGTFPPTDPPAA